MAEAGCKNAKTLQQISQIVRRLGCSPNSFSRLVYCGNCKEWYYAYHSICMKCRNAGVISVLFKSCKVNECCCHGSPEEIKEETNINAPIKYCFHQDKVAVTKELFINFSLGFIGDLIMTGWIPEMIDVKRSQIQNKIAYCVKNSLLCVSCSLNSLQNYIALGEKDLILPLKDYYCGIRTPSECSYAASNYLKQILKNDSIERMIMSVSNFTEEEINNMVNNLGTYYAQEVSSLEGRIQNLTTERENLENMSEDGIPALASLFTDETTDRFRIEEYRRARITELDLQIRKLQKRKDKYNKYCEMPLRRSSRNRKTTKKSTQQETNIDMNSPEYIIVNNWFTLTPENAKLHLFLEDNLSYEAQQHISRLKRDFFMENSTTYTLF